MFTASFLLALAAASPAFALSQGFNYASTFTDSSAKVQSDFETEFATAKNLVGTSGFTSARLYTMVQAGTPNTPIEAIPAAVSQQTSLLLGMWASGGSAAFDNELAALTSAILTYGTNFTDLVVGLSIGSEDLYRNSVIGIESKAGIGADPSVITEYISSVRTALAKTALSSVPIGHVDTWTAWVNGSNDAVISACDWIGMDAYPYFQNTMANSIDDGSDLFFSALDATNGVAAGKPVWITETGWPVSGPVSNLGVASLENAKTYWDNVACKILGKYNTWWYTLQDADPITPAPSFGLTTAFNTKPLYDLSCSAVSSSSSSSASASTSSLASSSIPKSTNGQGGSATLSTTGSSSAASVMGAPVAPSSVSPSMHPSLSTSVSASASVPVITSTAAASNGTKSTNVTPTAPPPQETNAANINRLSTIVTALVAVTVAAFSL